MTLFFSIQNVFFVSKGNMLHLYYILRPIGLYIILDIYNQKSHVDIKRAIILIISENDNIARSTRIIGIYTIVISNLRKFEYNLQ